MAIRFLHNRSELAELLSSQIFLLPGSEDNEEIPPEFNSLVKHFVARKIAQQDREEERGRKHLKQTSGSKVPLILPLLLREPFRHNTSSFPLLFLCRP